jgi:hypothetical protein
MALSYIIDLLYKYNVKKMWYLIDVMSRKYNSESHTLMHINMFFAIFVASGIEEFLLSWSL